MQGRRKQFHTCTAMLATPTICDHTHLFICTYLMLQRYCVVLATPTIYACTEKALDLVPMQALSRSTSFIVLHGAAPTALLWLEYGAHLYRETILPCGSEFCIDDDHNRSIGLFL